jgi:ABC-type transport system involved in Fe-S cluster assembly fused permease/ATPase subunit
MYNKSFDQGLVIGIVGAAVVCMVIFALFTTSTSEWRSNALFW